jgi:hypothetical protein
MALMSLELQQPPCPKQLEHRRVIVMLRHQLTQFSNMFAVQNRTVDLALPILALRDRFQMVRIDTPAITAQMIQYQSRWNRTKALLVKDAMSTLPLTPDWVPHQTVSGSHEGSLPNPTFSLCVDPIHRRRRTLMPATKMMRLAPNVTGFISRTLRNLSLPTTAALTETKGDSRLGAHRQNLPDGANPLAVSTTAQGLSRV